ncbi:MAG TPA: hypothetical protein VK485_01595 [Sphingomicrobium sp.]|nr:hypothetical protein [Sphingomicrobium sp.]
MNIGLLIAGIVALLVGGMAMIRPKVVRKLLGLADSEAATYALRIGGTMVGSFGLVLVGFAVAFALVKPLGGL